MFEITYLEADGTETTISADTYHKACNLVCKLHRPSITGIVVLHPTGWLEVV